MQWISKEDPSGHRVRWSNELAERYRSEGHWAESTLVDCARSAVAENPDKVLLIEGELKLPRRVVWDQSLRFASFLRSRGLEVGDTISFQLPNWVEAAVIALAARMLGLVVNPIPPIYRESELGYILADCGAKLIFVPEVFRKHNFRDMIGRLRESLPTLRDVVVVRGNGELRWEDCLSMQPMDVDSRPSVDPSSVMMAMYTSGTTGKPKGVLHTHHTFDNRVRAMGEAWAVGADDVIFIPSPVTHITGAFWVFDMPWVRGASSVLIDIWEADAGIRCIEQNRCTISGGATPFLQQLLQTGTSRPEAVRSLRLFFCGGTTVSPELIRQASETFSNCLFFRAYGSTEMTTATLGIRDRSQANLGATTDGEIVYPAEIHIVDPVGDAVLADGEEGEIVARGPGLFVGYIHPADNDGCFDADGFFRMGDLGRRVHGNYLVITGRKKDIIIRSGENISPKEVEDMLFEHPAVADVAIVAMPSEQTGEKGCAFVVLRAGQTLDLPEIRRFLEAAGLAKQKFPEHLEIVEDMPRVPSGKIKKDVLRVQARAIAAAAQAR